MEKHPIEHGALRMTGPIHSCHSRGSFIKKRAKLMDTAGSPCINGKSTRPAGEIKTGKRQPALTVIRKNSSVEQQHWFYRVDRIQKFAPAYITVTIDIKPGSYPNSINLGSNGNVPVAIFSTEDFDATTVDPLTITLAGAEVRIRGRGDSSRYYQDVDGDGLEIPEIEYEV